MHGGESRSFLLGGIVGVLCGLVFHLPQMFSGSSVMIQYSLYNDTPLAWPFLRYEKEL